ncbi:hypothetical protein DN748_01520 [Sinomicrobium soli]|nr:hypothetical protein DN748_01520 [Sinomicrobium sp. N-1-3-6]
MNRSDSECSAPVSRNDSYCSESCRKVYVSRFLRKME